jgi:hypothetical protein
MKNEKRSYNEKSEAQRELKRKEIQIKDFYYYNKTDSLWNESTMLNEPIKKYSHDNIDPNRTFKKTITNLDRIR